MHGTGEETAAGPQSDTVTKADFIPTKLEHYKVLHKLGQGGMGWVMLAEDTQLGRRVALKVMRSQHAAEKESRERFLREARAAAQLKHDHIITIYQVDEDQGIPFLAMELLEGGTLQQRLEYPKPLSLGAAVRIAREIAPGLAAAHERGVDPSRHQAGQYLARIAQRAGQDSRFRPGPAIRRQGRADAGGRDRRHAALHGPRTGAGQTGRCPLRPVQPGLHPVSHDDRHACPFAGDTLLATLTAIAVDMPTPVRDLNPQAPKRCAI